MTLIPMSDVFKIVCRKCGGENTYLDAYFPLGYFEFVCKDCEIRWHSHGREINKEINKG